MKRNGSRETEQERTHSCDLGCWSCLSLTSRSLRFSFVKQNITLTGLSYELKERLYAQTSSRQKAGWLVGRSPRCPSLHYHGDSVMKQEDGVVLGYIRVLCCRDPRHPALPPCSKWITSSKGTICRSQVSMTHPHQLQPSSENHAHSVQLRSPNSH